VPVKRIHYRNRALRQASAGESIAKPTTRAPLKNSKPENQLANQSCETIGLLLRAVIVEKLKSGAPIVPDHQVVGWPDKSIYKDRQVTLAKQLFKVMDIPREDKVKRAWWLERGFRFFDAPAAVIIATDRSLNESGPLLDLGAVMQISVWQPCTSAWAPASKIRALCIRKFSANTRHPSTKRLNIAIAIGYPDPDFPANQIRSEREPAENLTTWLE